jgi:hypothetical protein
MRRSVLLAAAGLVGLAVAAALLWPRSRSPEEQVRAAVREMEEGAEKRDLARVLDQVSESFRSPSLGDRADLKRLLVGEFFRGGGIRVATLQSEVRPEADGRIRFLGRLAVARAGGQGLAAVTEGELRQLHVDALFADEGGHWRVVEAMVRPVE